jgi:hypothetical protein
MPICSPSPFKNKKEHRSRLSKVGGYGTFFYHFSFVAGGKQFCYRGCVGVAAVKNTDLIPPLEGLPHHYHNDEQGANKRTKTP